MALKLTAETITGWLQAAGIDAEIHWMDPLKHASEPRPPGVYYITVLGHDSRHAKFTLQDTQISCGQFTALLTDPNCCEAIARILCDCRLITAAERDILLEVNVASNDP